MKIIIIFKKLYYYITGIVISFFMYDRQYVKGKDFQGKYFGILNRGWEWIYYDFMGRVFLGKNKKVKFPVSAKNQFNNSNNIVIGRDEMYIFQGQGKYFQAQDAKIIIGKNCHIANNVGLITTNHNPDNPNKHEPGRDIIINDNCWIGMNAVILPGVELGKNTTVGAGAVVTKSFQEGNCIIVGTPAKIIKQKNEKK